MRGYYARVYQGQVKPRCDADKGNYFEKLFSDKKNHCKVEVLQAMTKEFYPRIFKTRTINKRFGNFYGPYSHISSMYAILELIKKVFKPRTCRLPLSPERIAKGDFKPCLEYYIHNCGAPCIDKQSYDEYQENIRQAREILKGNTRDVEQYLRSKMMEYAGKLEFEKAEEYKQRIHALDNFAAKSEIVSHTITDVDVLLFF